MKFLNKNGWIYDNFRDWMIYLCINKWQILRLCIEFKVLVRLIVCVSIKIEVNVYYMYMYFRMQYKSYSMLDREKNKVIFKIIVCKKSFKL